MVKLVGLEFDEGDIVAPGLEFGVIGGLLDESEVMLIGDGRGWCER